jgi:uncharacterized protein YigA (DUF484 family)
MFALDTHPALGTLPAWITLLALAVVGWYVVRGQSGTALGILRDSNQVLTDRIRALQEEAKRDRARIAELEATRSLEVIAEQVQQGFAEQREVANARLAVVVHEAEAAHRRAEERHALLVALIERVGDELAHSIRVAANGSD